MQSDIKIIERERIEFENPTVIIGFPDIGLVGTIATYHMIYQMNLREVAYIESDDFPPVTVIHNGRPVSPMRIYGNKKLIFVVSEIPIKPSLLYSISRKLVKWFKSKNVDLVISLGGIPHPRRLEIEKPKVYGISINEYTDKILKENNVEGFEEGIIVGPYAVLIYECMKNGINSIYLMAESHATYPDPESAAIIIKLLNKILNLNIDVKELIEKGEEIKIKSRDLMKRTETALKEMQKIQEHEMPMMYR
ncbi:MAG: proteasome assembly chaperone family protein [Candidatus Altiarchaeales archaeon]|nr:MAG: proteasome assembly chaperone family protein [Candidatus Altiarchaeales archaeon]